MLDLVLILAVVVLIFGTKKLRTLGSELGGAVKSFRKAMAEPRAEQRLEQAASGRPDAEFPESTAERERSQRDGA